MVLRLLALPKLIFVYVLASTMFAVCKDGKIRICCDYKSYSLYLALGSWLVFGSIAI